MKRALAITLLMLAAAGGVAVAQPPPQQIPLPDPDEPPPPEASSLPPQAPIQPPSVVVPTDPATALREANAAATAGDWGRVSTYIEALLARSLDRTDLAEAHRLAGIAALFMQPPRRDLAEQHFLEYLRIDLDGQLDPALYPPEVITFFSDVRARHSAELKARRPKKRYAALTLLPPFGQFQNGDRTKGIVVGALLGTFLVTNLTTYFLLRSWCSSLHGPGGDSAGCDESTNRNDTATTLRGLNITAGVGLIITYVYGVYDGVRGYRRSRGEPALAPYATSTNTMTTLGVQMKF